MKPLELNPQDVPLEPYEGKVYRVRGTRVPLETVIGAFNAGLTAEGIVDAFPALKLADVYSVISFYLRNRPQVEAYVCEQEQEAAGTAAGATGTPEYQQWRDRLISRANAAKAG